MKVALALPYVRRGFGIEHRTVRLAQGLPPDIERALLCLEQETQSTVPTFGFPTPLAKLLQPIRHSALTRLVLERRFASRLDRDWIVDAQYAPLTALRPRGPLVVTWYSVPPLEYAASSREAHAWRADRAAMLKGAARADLVLCISHATADEIGPELPSGARTEVLYIGCDTPLTTPPGPREGRRILSIGRFAPHKSHEDTLAAAAAVRRALPGRDVEVVLCGTGSPGDPYLESLKTWAASLGLDPGTNAHFVLNASSRAIDLLLASSDVFISASRWEGFGMPLVEAQGAGLPAVAYRLWSHPEVVAQPEHLVQEGDIDALAAAVVGLLDDETEWRKASDQAREFVVSKFSWSDVIDRYVALLGSI